MKSLGYLRHSFQGLYSLKSSRVSSSMISSQYRGNHNKATTENPQEQSEPSDSEKKLLNEVQNLSSQVKALEEKNNELLDKYKRSLADGENMRQRLTKQISDAKVFGIQSFCKDLLEVADILGHATNSIPKEEINDKNPHLKNLYDGLVLTQNSLNQVFRRHGLEIIEALNSKFDPNLHEALFQKDCKDVPPGTVIEVSKIGYKLHNRCIRPALVGVSKS